MKKALSITFFLFATNLLTIGLSLSTEASTLRCSESPVAFDFETEEGLECLCETATEAIKHLRAMGLRTSECIIVHLIDVFPTEGEHRLFGAFDPYTQRVSVLEYSKAKAIYSSQAPTPGLEMTKDFWCSFAAHELAHAVIHQNQFKMDITRVSEEYIASVIQLMVLAPETLAELREAFSDIEGYKSLDEMSETYFLLDPYRFALKCYLHYLSLKEPQQFIAELTQPNK